MWRLLRNTPLVPVVCVAVVAAVAAGGYLHPSPDRILQTGAFALTAAFVALGAIAVPRFGADAARSSSVDASSGASRLIPVAFLLIVVAGALLRLTDIDFGLPHPYHPDELRKSAVIRGMLGRHSFDPQYFLHPTLLLYLTEGMLHLLELARPLGVQSLVNDDLNGMIILSGRLVSCVAGVITIALAAMLGGAASRVGSPHDELQAKLVGLGAAAITALSPLLITCSRYFKEDSLLTMFVTLSAALLLRAMTSERSTAAYYLSALAAGFACGTKYSGVIALLPVAAAPLLDNRIAFRRLPIAVSLAIIAFVLCTPYAVLTPDAFFAGLASESEHARTGHLGTGIRPWSQLWCFHFWGSVIPGLGLLPTLLGLAAAGYAARSCARGDRSSIGLAFVSLSALLWYLSAEAIPSKPFPQPDRYILPVLPFLGVMASCITFRAVAARGRPDGKKRILAFLVVMSFVIAAPAAMSVRLARALTPDTRLEMRRFMDAELPKKAKILTMGGTVYLPRFAAGHFVVRSARSIIGKEKERIVERLVESGYEYLLVSSFETDRRYFDQESDREKAQLAAFAAIEGSLPVVHRAADPASSYGFHNPTLVLYALRPTS